MKILALGDSYTIGEGVSLSENFPNQLADKLRDEGVLVSKVSIIAKTGWTTDELLKGIAMTELDEVYDLVFLLIGVNNQYRGYPLSEYEVEFTKLLQFAITKSLKGVKNVFVLSIPDWGNTFFAEGRDKEKIKNEIDAFNNVNLTESKAQKVNYIEITSLTRQSPLSAALLASDGLHPSAAMYSQWIDKIFIKINE